MDTDAFTLPHRLLCMCITLIQTAFELTQSDHGPEVYTLTNDLKYEPIVWLPFRSLINLTLNIVDFIDSHLCSFFCGSLSPLLSRNPFSSGLTTT